MAIEYLSKWNALSIFVYKLGQVHCHFTFNYHFIHEDISAIHMETVTNIYNLFSIPSNKSLFTIDIKYGCWIVNIHLDDNYYPTFYIPKIG